MQQLPFNMLAMPDYYDYAHNDGIASIFFYFFKKFSPLKNKGAVFNFLSRYSIGVLRSFQVWGLLRGIGRIRKTALTP